MRKTKKRILSYLILLTFILSNFIGATGMTPVYADENKSLSDYADPISFQPDSGQAIRGIPGFISKPATQEDVDYLNSRSLSESSISFSILPDPGSTKAFTVYDPATDSISSVNFTLERIGEHSYIYLQKDNSAASQVTASMLDNMVAEFEAIYEKNVTVFGAPPDVDKDKRINILLTDIEDNYAGSYIAGFFDSENQLPKVSHPDSNECEVFFMNIDDGLPIPGAAETNFFGTLAHEFQHMIQYGTYLDNYSPGNQTEVTWLNEGLACLAEYVNGYGHPVGQIEDFLTDSMSTSFGLTKWESGSLASYGASYLFTLYMYEQFKLVAPSFISDLAADPETGIESINSQLTSHGISMDFDEVFEKSQVAIAVDDDDPGITDDAGEFAFDTIDIPAIRQQSYDGSYYYDMRFYSFSNYVTTPTPARVYNGTPITISTYTGKYRSYAGIFDGSKVNPSLNVLFANTTGSYYIVKPTDVSAIANTYSAFTDVPKTIEKIEPGTSSTTGANVIKFGDNQWMMLIYIAKDVPINNTITVTGTSDTAPDSRPSTPASLSADRGYNTVRLTWDPSSYTGGVEGYNVYRDGLKLNTTALVLTTSYTDRTVTPSGSYNYEVEAVGYDGQVSLTPATISVGESLSGPEPTLGVPTISYVDTGVSTSAYIGVNLTAPADTTGIDHYEISVLIDGMADGYYDEGITAGINNLGGLENGRTYTLYAFAVDASYNYSAASNKIYVKAGTGGGLATFATAPTAPAGVNALEIKETKVTLQWTASTQAEGIKEYNVYRDKVFVGKATGGATQYTDSGLAASTEYSYTVEAVGNDDDNLNSDYSDLCPVTTASGPPALTADTTANNVDNALQVTFPDDPTWRSSITAVKVGTTTLTAGKYLTAPGILTLNLGTIRTSDNHTVTVIANGYTNATVVQSVSSGAVNASRSTASVNQSLSVGVTRTITPTAKDQYNNPVQGQQFYMNITITNNTPTSIESYIVAGTPYTASAAGIVAGNTTDANGQTTLEISTPATIDYNDGISIQFKLAADGSNVGNAIGYTRVKSSGGGSGGGGGGGGGSSSTTTTTPSPTQTSGETVITTGTINDQINSTTTDTVTVNINGTSNEQTAVIPSDVLGVLDSKDKSISINTNDVSMTFAPEIIGSAISSLAKDSSLKVSVKKLSSDTVAGTLPSSLDDSSKGLYRVGKNIFQFEAKLAGKDKTTDLTSFNKDITITLSLKDTDLSAIDTGKLGVYYFNEKSKAWEYVGGKYDPTTKSITFKTNHFSYYTIMKYEKSFSDIKGHWAQADVEKLAAKHVFKNMAEEQFDPQAKITRAEFIAMLVRALELKSSDVKPIAFKDIAVDKYYYGEVMTASKLGITTGDDTGKFRPGDNITREQLAAMIARALTYVNKSPALTEAQVNEKLSTYTDKDKVSSFARNAMAIALEKKIINGWKFDLLAPKENATRAEAAVMINRLLSGL